MHFEFCRSWPFPKRVYTARTRVLGLAGCAAAVSVSTRFGAAFPFIRLRPRGFSVRYCSFCSLKCSDVLLRSFLHLGRPSALRGASRSVGKMPGTGAAVWRGTADVRSHWQRAAICAALSDTPCDFSMGSCPSQSLCSVPVRSRGVSVLCRGWPRARGRRPRWQFRRSVEGGVFGLVGPKTPDTIG